MNRLRVPALMVLVAAASCTTTQAPAPLTAAAPAVARPKQVAPPAPVSVPPAVHAPTTTSAPAPPVASPPTAHSAVPPSRPAAPGAPQKNVAPPVVVPRAAATAPPAPAAKPATPPLDLGSLEQRLRDTRAIGVFTKLSLKNQVDTLLEQFRAKHKGASIPTLAELRQRYDLLLLKVLSLLQDDDPTLAQAITTSREAIWDVLADPREFAKI